jgi:hypothetical protein
VLPEEGVEAEDACDELVLVCVAPVSASREGVVFEDELSEGAAVCEPEEPPVEVEFVDDVVASAVSGERLTARIITTARA